MSTPLLLGLLLAAAQPLPAEAPRADLRDDPALLELVRESLAQRPELRAAEAQARAERERIPQAGALPDPILSLGIQNDGFSGIQVGKMETSFWQVMLTQPLPWPGKRGLRADVAAEGARLAERGADRARLSAEADVRRAWLELLLARDRLALLGRLEALWVKAEGLARVRYQAGEGSQADLLRAQLEQTRLRQRRWALEADDRTRLQALNRLRGRPLDEPLPTVRAVADLGLPAVPAAQEALEEAERRSPELQRARLEVARAGRQGDLARRDRWPDLALTAAIMPRGGLEPMWSAGVSVTLPVFSSARQSRAVAESDARAAASASAEEAVRQVLRQRVQERLALQGSLVRTAALYREGLLVQTQAAAESTLAQYRAGRVTFASVLEALGGVVADEDGHLQAVAAAWRVAIAADEVSLEPAGAAAGGGMGGGSVPGAGAAGGAMAAGASAAQPPAGGEAVGGASMSKM